MPPSLHLARSISCGLWEIYDVRIMMRCSRLAQQQRLGAGCRVRGEDTTVPTLSPTQWTTLTGNEADASGGRDSFEQYARFWDI